jgi:hypothetical protein
MPLLVGLTLAFEKGPCPEGFEHLGRLYDSASGGVGHEAKVPAGTVKTLALPENYEPDTSYQQSDIRGAGGHEAGSNLSPSQVPPGFHLIPHGSESGGCQGWAVSNPKVIVLKRKGRMILQEGLEMNMYCHSGSGEVCKDGRGCNVTVDVCVKPMRR